MTASPDIFLSYNREDADVARRFAEGFAAQGFEVWWDQALRSGEAYDKVTENALRSAKAVVVLWSPRSVDSRWVRAEATLADRNRTLVPARIEPCDLPIMFELTQTANLSHWQGEASDPAWRAFLSDVRKLVGAKTKPASAVPAASQPSRGRKPSIAVLPFVNRSGQEEDDIFAIGMVEDLTAALSLSKRMKVIASSATSTYRTGARDLRQIGLDLGVRYLLEGNVRRVGDSLRVTAQLVEADDGDIVWTEKFDRPLSELADLQEELVTEVAACLGAEVHRSEIEHALRKPGDISAWEAVLRADANLARGTRAGNEAAIEQARLAISIDPGYDLALATLATALAMQYSMQGGDDPALKEELLAAIGRARAVEPNDPIALSRLGMALGMAGRIDEGLILIERGVRLNPNLETPHIALSNAMLHQGRWDEAIAEAEKVERLAPNGHWTHAALGMIARGHIHAGRFELAREFATRSLLFSDSVLGQIFLIVSLEGLGDREAAANEMRRLRVRDPDMSLAGIRHMVERSFFVPAIGKSRQTDFLETLRRLWDETGGDSQSANHPAGVG